MVSARQFFPIFFLAQAACAPTASPPTPSEGEVQEEVASLWAADTRTILTSDAARDLTHQCSRVSPGPVTDVWTPSDTDVAAIEDQLISLVAQKMEEAGLSASPGDYYRQYAGFVIDGQRVIYTNGVVQSVASEEHDARAAIHTPGYSWRTHAVRICDGGAMTFGVEYDVATRQFSNFEFNGSLGGPLGN